MVTLVDKNKEKVSFPHVNDDFDKYLTEQQLKTTFNGIEVAAFSWYQKLLGLR
ncbi:MAG: hypothetical protein V2B14_03400 [bacterium]